MHIFRNKNAIRSIILFSLLLMFCGHAFCYANLSFSGPSVMVDASKANGTLIADGQFLTTMYWRVRGSLSAPLIVGMLSSLYLAASAVLIADMLRITHPLSLFSLCGVLMLNVSVTAINASMLHMADVYFLAFLFAALSAWLCQIHPLGFISGAICFAAVPGLEPSMSAAAPALVLITFLLRILDGDGARTQLAALIRSLAGIAAGFAMYYVVALLFCHRQGADLTLSFQFTNLADMYLAPIRQLFALTTSYAALCAFLFGALLAICVLITVLSAFSLKLSSAILSIGGMLLLPLVLGVPTLALDATHAVSDRYVYCLLPAAMIALFEYLYSGRISVRGLNLRRLITLCFGVTFLSSIVFSNQVYLKKNLEYQTTLSIMTRVIEMAEQTEGYDSTVNTVAIIGSIEDSPLSVPHKGFEHLAVLDAAANNFTASSQSENIWYFWEIMGYPFNFISDYERDQLAATPAVQAMPSFPDKGCCQMIGHTLVIRLSE